MIGADATAVCVLGMSRSGTSLTTSVLSLAGVYLGPERELLQDDLHQLAGEGEAVLARARAANPKGFWEHYRLVRLNDRILRAFGGSWREPPELPAGWETSDQLADLRDEARALLDESFSGQPLWGWKDPRSCLTLPFWQQLAPNLRYVVCLRNPVDVAASLERRDGMARADGIALWKRYVAAALAATSGQPRLLVSYESYFGGGREVAARLARFVGRPDAFEDPDRARRLGETVDDRLWRNRSGRDAILRAASVPTDVAGLHLVAELLCAADAGAGAVPAELDEAVGLLAGRLLGGGAAESRAAASPC